MISKGIPRMLIAVGILISAGSGLGQTAQPETQDPHLAPLVESLLSFHSGVLGDTVKIDWCSVVAAVHDPVIVSRLSSEARATLTKPDTCSPDKSSNQPNQRGLISFKVYPDSVIAEIEAKNGHYVHLATYKAFPARDGPAMIFTSVVLHHFAFSGSLPPPTRRRP
jgi:hypothetical protein